MKFSRPNRVLALDSQACGVDWSYDAPAQDEPLIVGSVAVVKIRGPLSHHAEWFFDSYDQITQRVRAAFESSAKAVYISGDTPGGDVSGCFSTARIMRRMADESGKPFIWYVDGQTCSAGLALAMACDQIILPPEARFGSIGVIAELESYAKQAEAHGLEWALVTSGSRKADGHPLAPIDEAVLAEVQSSVDYEARLFFEWVSERTGVSVATVEGWQAAVFHGQQAIDIGLADALSDDQGAFAIAAGLANDTGDTTMPGMQNKSAGSAATAASAAKKSSLDEARKMLGELAAEDSDEGRRARKMLDASDAEDEEPKDDKAPPKEPDGDEGADGGDEGSAEDDTDDDSAEDESDAKRAEDEDAAAKAEDEDAKKASARAYAALQQGKADVALRETNRANAAKSRAKQHRVNARTLRSQAGVAKQLGALTKAVAKVGRAPGGTARVAEALAATSARGTQPAVVAPNAAPKMPASMARAFGLGGAPVMTAESVDFDGESVELGILDPAEAKKLFESTQAAVAEIRRGK